MPFKKKQAFVSAEEVSTDDLLMVIAHELGHGTFRLYHTFSEKNDYAVSRSTTDNLMDYNNGKELHKYQWDLIKDPQGEAFAIFMDEEEVAMEEGLDCKVGVKTNLEDIKEANSEEEEVITISSGIDYDCTLFDVEIGETVYEQMWFITTFDQYDGSFSFNPSEYKKTELDEYDDIEDNFVRYDFGNFDNDYEEVMLSIIVMKDQAEALEEYLFRHEHYETVNLADVQWISQFNNMFSNYSCYNYDACCFVAANQILSKSGVSTDRTQQVVVAKSTNSDCSNLSAKDNANEGLRIINISLDKHKLPIIVGVHHPRQNESTQEWSHYCSGNIPKITNHYIVIVGKGYDEQKDKNYFRFYEVGTSHASKGKSVDNKLYIESNGLIIGNTKFVDKEGYYTITEVRKNIKKTYKDQKDK
jgi:hypothetical protein